MHIKALMIGELKTAFSNKKLKKIIYSYNRRKFTDLFCRSMLSFLLTAFESIFSKATPQLILEDSLINLNAEALRK